MKRPAASRAAWTAARRYQLAWRSAALRAPMPTSSRDCRRRGLPAGNTCTITSPGVRSAPNSQCGMAPRRAGSATPALARSSRRRSAMGADLPVGTCRRSRPWHRRSRFLAGEIDGDGVLGLHVVDTSEDQAKNLLGVRTHPWRSLRGAATRASPRGDCRCCPGFLFLSLHTAPERSGARLR